MVKISKKVLDFMEKKRYIGILITHTVMSGGWAGCVDIIRGEFIKNVEDIEYIDKKKSVEINVSGMRVFVPSNMEHRNFTVNSSFRFFNFYMSLGVDLVKKR